jgi:hypothetical protein
MLVGSKVRMLHGMGEGIVTKAEGDKITVLLEQGLEIPVHKRDLVLISGMEAKMVPDAQSGKGKPENPKPVPSKMFFVKEGVYLASFPGSAMLSEYTLINFTDYQLFILAYKICKPLNQFYQVIRMEPKSVEKLPESFPNQATNHWVGMQFQVLKYHESQGDAQACKEFRLSFSDQDWKKNKTKVPLLEKEGFLIQMDGSIQKINPEALKNSLLTQKEKIEPKAIERPEKKLEWREVDLHIEKLNPDPGNLSAGEILDIQLNAFEKALDKALTDGIGSLVAIHGVGSGVLKNEIHRKVSNHPHVQYFKEGRKEKFGYGATEIKFK